MKAILEYTLPEEQEDYRTALNGHVYRQALHNLDQKLRSVIKHDTPLGGDDIHAACETLRAFIREELDGVEL